MTVHANRRFALLVTFLVVFAFAIVPACSKTAGKVPRAESVVNDALKAAKAQDKVVLIHFGASWCEWCHRLDAAFESPDLSKLFLDNYVIAHLTVQESEEKKALENPGAEEMLAEIGGAKAGIPVYIFINKDGVKIANSLVMPSGVNIGYPVIPEEIKAFDGLLERTAPRMTAAQRAQIVDWLTQHAPKV